MKILHLTTLHPPQDVRITHKECRSLAGAGHEVSLAAPVEEPVTIEGIPVVPIGTTEVRTGLLNLARRLSAAWRAARSSDPDVYHLHDPELIPLGLALSLRGATVVYDAHEDVPLDLLTLGDPDGRARLHARAWKLLQGLAGRRFAAVVAATPGIAESFPSEKTVVVRNFPLAEELDAFAGPPLRERERAVVYLGRISEDRGIRTMLRAAELADATLVLAGPVREDLLDALRGSPEWGRVDYRGVLSRSEVAAQLRRVRVGLVLLEPRKAYLESLPVKLFEYFAAGLPVVASDFPLWRELVADCGVLVDPSNAEDVAAALRRLLDEPDEARALGERGRAAVRERYKWERESAALLGLYDRLARTSS
jgi:glycosyltransferase involved in cell wall biosynthesis